MGCCKMRGRSHRGRGLSWTAHICSWQCDPQLLHALDRAHLILRKELAVDLADAASTVVPRIATASLVQMAMEHAFTCAGGAGAPAGSCTGDRAAQAA